MNNCAWCGELPDENGSHSICQQHAQAIYAQMALRAKKRLEESEESRAKRALSALVPSTSAANRRFPNVAVH
jgi:hypothetical protein